ncbi:MAG: ATP-binding protein [Chitinophagaceae bacterium]
MRSKQFILYLLGIFFTTILLIVFLQFNSNGNINKLIHGNESLIREFEVVAATQKVQTGMLYIESEIHRTVIGEDSGYVADIKKRELSVRSGLFTLTSLLVADSTRELILRLDSLIDEKLKFGNNVLNALFTNGRTAAEEMYESRKGKNAMGEIVAVIDSMNSPRRAYLTSLAMDAELSGQQAKWWGIILAITAVLACIFTFWYIAKRTRRQQQLFDQVNDSEKKVREAGIMKQNFMANMSHEIRTPLNAILGFTNLLQHEKLNEKSVEFVRNIQHSGESLLAIVNDILDFSKIEAGMMRIESSPFNLRELLHSVETMFLPRIKPKNLQLTIDIDKSVPDVLKGDPVRLTQIIVNLVNNSVKFTNTGGIYLRVIGEPATGKMMDISFSVKDTGIGIAADKMDTIFERFQQVDEDTTRKYGGTGLGLSIVRQLVELQSGTISVSSVQNMGTEFTFTIPYEVATEVAEKNQPERSVVYESNSGETQVRILVAEDNVMNQTLLKHLLAEWKYDITIVNNGLEAVELLRHDKFSLMLMDIQMPQMDGYTATQKIRNELKNPIPIIAMTAHAMAGEREKCLMYGMNEYVSKPIREHELHRIITTLLKVNGKHGKDAIFHTGHHDKVVNLDYLKELSGGDRHFEVNMIGQFLKQVPVELDTMQDAFDKNNYEGMAQVAHTLKTSVAFMGLNGRLDNFLSSLENTANADKGETLIREDIKAVNKICQQALREAREYLGHNY